MISCNYNIWVSGMSFDASSLLTQLLQRYGGCEAYQDRGRASSGRKVIEFATDFVRPTFFIFRWRMPSGSQKAIVSGDGTTKLLVNGVWSPQESLDWALRATEGSSLLTSGFIGSLLMPELCNYVYSSANLMPFSFTTDCNDPTPGTVRRILSSRKDNPIVVQELDVNLDELRLRKLTTTLKMSIDVIDSLSSYEDKVEALNELSEREYVSNVTSFDWAMFDALDLKGVRRLAEALNDM